MKIDPGGAYVLSGTGSRGGPPKRADRDLRNAWVAVALLPVALVAAIAPAPAPRPRSCIHNSPKARIGGR